MTQDWRISTYPQFVQEDSEDGPYTAKRFGIQADHADGMIYIYSGYSVRSQDEAEKVAESFILRQTPAWTPVNNDLWHFFRHVYGSSSYQGNYSEAEGSLMTEQEIHSKRIAGVVA